MNVMAIDIGLNNFICAANNIGKPPFIIKGGRLKNINGEYNRKKLSCGYRERKRLFDRRSRDIKHFFHIAIKYIIDFAKDNNIAVIVIGKINNWEHRFGKNDICYDFEFIPIKWFTDKLKANCRKNNIKIKLINEKFTSGTSFMDNEKVNGRFYDKSRRQNGIFKTSVGADINADVNDSYQIMRKAYPNIQYDETFLTEPIILDWDDIDIF